jgi:hypothetical protein
MFNLRFLAGALALCVALPTAVLAEGETCTTRDQLSALIAERLPQAKVVTLGGSEARMFMATFNRLPPATEMAADEIVIVDQASGMPIVRVVLFERGCMKRIGALPRGMVQALLNAVTRGGA